MNTIHVSKKLDDFFTSDIAEQTGLLEKKGGANPLVCGLEYDSRAVVPGSLYFALPGIHADGHCFIDDAIKNGALVIVHQNDLSQYDLACNDDVVYLRVKDSRFAMSAIAAAFYDYPSKHLVVLGVTGTEGKSTTVYLIFQLLRCVGKKAGFISTVQYSIDGSEQWNSEHQTTPEAMIIHKRLAEMLANGAEYAVIEASSHGLSSRTNRLGDVVFDVGIMTNVTHEHLEFHGTWEQYRFDKANLFRALNAVNHTKLNGTEAPVFGIVNADDASAKYFADSAVREVFSHSACGDDADASVLRILSAAQGNEYDVHLKENDSVLRIKDNLPGAFNVGNVMAALLAVSHILKMPIQDLVQFVPLLKPVRGRMTAIQKGQNFEVIVDYAHTPSSFETILPPLRGRLKKGCRIITVFGSAGERDTQKRPQQGRIAAVYSDIIVLCDEDPRGEDPLAILEDIAAGVVSAAENGWNRNENLFLIPDRKAAIRKAFSLAKSGDIVLLLGKGHENSIIYKDGSIKYDEITEAENALDPSCYTSGIGVKYDK